MAIRKDAANLALGGGYFGVLPIGLRMAIDRPGNEGTLPFVESFAPHLDAKTLWVVGEPHSLGDGALMAVKVPLCAPHAAHERRQYKIGFVRGKRPSSGIWHSIKHVPVNRLLSDGGGPALGTA